MEASDQEDAASEGKAGDRATAPAAPEPEPEEAATPGAGTLLLPVLSASKEFMYPAAEACAIAIECCNEFLATHPHVDLKLVVVEEAVRACVVSRVPPSRLPTV